MTIPLQPLVPTLLLSLHPENTAAIITGKKVIEYRRRFFAEPFQAFVYTTGPNGGVNLFITCDQPIKADAQKLAAIGELIQHDDYDELVRYFSANDTGLIVPITSYVQFPMIRLAELRRKFTNFVTPQGYTFLDKLERQAQLTYFQQQPVLKTQTIDWTPKYRAIEALE
ncbi:hypothetical protein ACFP1L_11360 [Lactiplantibacillus nangangensis]|uniref:ASCH domain-containing protein n=1 Tax=Lactiplantibacillus nangangensis TaxID=2559917 RepID=A0ABW1SMI0_9LACO|nr:hypothetical protein [Lactiplantibacillus nangangensis]